MLAFTPSRTSMLLFGGCLTAVLALRVGLTARRTLGDPAGWTAAILLVLAPLIQVNTRTIMADMLVAVFCFEAIVAYGRYLDRVTMRDAAAFGLFASLAILTKYNALALALLPPLALVWSGRWDLSRRGSFWLPAGVVLFLCGPWYLWNYSLVVWASEPYPSLDLAAGALAANCTELLRLAGWAGAPMALVGVAVFAMPLRRYAGGIWIASGALILAVLIFDSLVYPTVETRYLCVAAAPLLLLGSGGAVWVGSRWASGRWRWAGATLLILAALPPALQVPKVETTGYDSLALRLTETPSPTRRILVSGDVVAEGTLISEVASRDERPGLQVLRASKMLVHRTGNGAEVELRYRSPEAIRRFLDAAAVSIIVMDEARGYFSPHHRLLRTAMQQSATEWKQLPSEPGGLIIYERLGPVNRNPAPIRIEMPSTLNETLGG